MERKTKIRALRRGLENISERYHHDYCCDMEMDGSGECGGMISSFYEKAQIEAEKALFDKIGITPEEFYKELTEYMKVEEKYIQPWETPLAAMDLMNLSTPF